MMASAMESILTYDAAVVAEGCVVPALYIAADEPQPRTDMGRLHELLSAPNKTTWSRILRPCRNHS